MKILYDGIGSNPSGEHTEEEFLKIMSKEFTHKNWSATLKRIERREEHDQFVFKDWILPDDFVFFTLNDWIDSPKKLPPVVSQENHSIPTLILRSGIDQYSGAKIGN